MRKYPYLSYTSIRDYEKCPFKYYIVHKLLFKESDTFKIKKGNISHKILNKIHKTSLVDLNSNIKRCNVFNNIFEKNIPEPVIIAHLALFANKKNRHQLHVFIFFKET